MALIMYCCEMCWKSQSEACGYVDRTELREASDGTWLCNGCWGEHEHPGGDEPPGFSDGRDIPEYGSIEVERLRCADLASSMKIGGPVYGANEGNARYDEACEDIASAIRAISEEEDALKPECPLCGRADTHSHQIP